MENVRFFRLHNVKSPEATRAEEKLLTGRLLPLERSSNASGTDDSLPDFFSSSMAGHFLESTSWALATPLRRTGLPASRMALRTCSAVTAISDSSEAALLPVFLGTILDNQILCSRHDGAYERRRSGRQSPGFCGKRLRSGGKTAVRNDQLRCPAAWTTAMRAKSFPYGRVPGLVMWELCATARFIATADMPNWILWPVLRMRPF